MRDLNFSAKSAQKIVRRFVADEISYLLRTGEPDLVMGKRLYADNQNELIGIFLKLAPVE